MSLRSPSACVLVLLLATSDAAATVLWRGDFETGTLKQWSGLDSPARISVVTSPVREGKNAGRLEVHPTDLVGGHTRVLVSVMAPASSAFLNADVYYAWSAMTPADQPIVTGSHQIAFWEADRLGMQVLAFDVDGSSIALHSKVKYAELWRGTFTPGTWHDFVLHVKWSPDPAVGFVELWYDGRKALDRKMLPNMFRDGSGQPVSNTCHQGIIRANDITAVEVLFLDGAMAATDLAEILGNYPLPDGGVVARAGPPPALPDGGARALDAGARVAGDGAAPTTDAGEAIGVATEPEPPPIDVQPPAPGRAVAGGCSLARTRGPSPSGALPIAALAVVAALAGQRRRRTWHDVVTREQQVDELLGLPFVARDVAAYKVMLAFDAYETLLGLQGLDSALGGQLAQPDLLPQTRRRLEHYRSANDEHLLRLARLLRPLGYQSIGFTEFEQYLSRRSAGPLLMRHYDNLFRDWADWGAAENAATLELARRVAAPLAHVETAVHLGAGACRLPYELHRALGIEHSLCVDHNPFLLACARAVVAGERLDLFAFPPVPRSADSYAVEHTLHAPAPIADGIEFLVHDLEDWGLRAGCFDLVVTPWFIDAVQVPTPRLFSLINAALPDGGHWLNLGPTGFNTRDLATYYSPDEVLTLVEMAGFELLAHELAPLPYFQHDPASSHGRTEHVLAFLARKRTAVDVVAPAAAPALPPWLEDVTRPVEPIAHASVLRRSHAFCLDLLDGLVKAATVAGLARTLAAKHGLEEDQAQYLIANTLLGWTDAARHNPMKFTR